LRDPELARLVGLERIARRMRSEVKVDAAGEPLADALRRFGADPRRDSAG
jgi:hypothetical protein